MYDQVMPSSHGGRLRGDSHGYAGLDDTSRSPMALQIKSTHRNESAHYLAVVSRYCHDDHFANMVDIWTHFVVPQLEYDIRRAAHSAPPAQSLADPETGLQYASCNTMQRWIYRLLTLSHCRIDPTRPICISHTAALQQLVACWMLAGSQFCALETREEFRDPVLAHKHLAFGTCQYARQIMCDMLWLELCYLRGERNSIEQATRGLRARIAEYSQFARVDLDLEPSLKVSTSGPRRHRRNVTERQFDRATLRQSTVREGNKRWSMGATMGLTNLGNEAIQPASTIEKTSQKTKRWSWNNPLKPKTHVRNSASNTSQQLEGLHSSGLVDKLKTHVRKSASYTGQQLEGLRSNDLVDTDRPLPLPPNSQISSKCMLHDRRNGASARRNRTTAPTDSFHGRRPSGQYPVLPNDGAHRLSNFESNPALRTKKTCSDQEYQAFMAWKPRERTSKEEIRNDNLALGYEGRHETVNSGFEEENKDTVSHSWLDLDNSDSES